jgi:hypothetical protein
VSAATGRERRKRRSGAVILPPLLALAVSSAATSADAKVLRSTEQTAMIAVFKDIYALDRFNKLPDNARSDANAVGSLLTCSVPQRSRIACSAAAITQRMLVSPKAARAAAKEPVPIRNVRDRRTGLIGLDLCQSRESASTSNALIGRSSPLARHRAENKWMRPALQRQEDPHGSVRSDWIGSGHPGGCEFGSR